jgi:hypothetical protein
MSTKRRPKPSRRRPSSRPISDTADKSPGSVPRTERGTSTTTNEPDSSSETSPAGRKGSLLKRAAIAAIGLVAAWAVGFFGPGLWESAKVAAGQDPLAVAVLVDQQMGTFLSDDVDEEIVPGVTLSQFPKEPMTDDEFAEVETRGWTYSPDEIDAMTTAVRLVFTGTRSETVTMQKLSIRVTDRRPPARAMNYQQGKGASATPHYIRANIDSGEIVWTDDKGRPTPPSILVFSRGEQEIIDLLATTTECDCYWVLDVTYSVGSKTGILTVPARGHFRTSALSRTARFYEGDSGGKWKCEDFADLTPTLCDKLPPWVTDGSLSIARPPRTAEKHKGWGLWSDLAGG